MEIIEEVRKAIEKELGVPEKIIKEILAYLKENIVMERVEEIPEGVCRAPKDDVILGLVKKVRADYLITDDKDLLTMNEFESTSITTPRHFWEIVRNTDKS